MPDFYNDGVIKGKNNMETLFKQNSVTITKVQPSALEAEIFFDQFSHLFQCQPF